MVIPPICIAPHPFSLWMDTWSWLAVLGHKQLYALQLSTHFFLNPSCLPFVGRLHNVARFWFRYTTNFHHTPSICTLDEHIAWLGVQEPAMANQLVPALPLSTHMCLHTSGWLLVVMIQNAAWLWFGYTTYFRHTPSICTLH